PWRRLCGTSTPSSSTSTARWSTACATRVGPRAGRTTSTALLRADCSNGGSTVRSIGTDRARHGGPMFAMHAPDGFLEPGVAFATALLSVAIVGLALRRSSAELAERQVPLAGLTAAFVFAAQMFNFPVAAGTTGHLLGGALAAILLGPWVGTLSVTVVVVVQALLFADGGLSALGYNVLNMAIVP